MKSDFTNAWQAAQSVTDREACWAKQQALTLIRIEIDATVKRDLGDKNTHNATSR